MKPKSHITANCLHTFFKYFLVTFASSWTAMGVRFPFSIAKFWIYWAFMHTNLILFYVTYEITNIYKTISQTNMIFLEYFELVQTYKFPYHHTYMDIIQIYFI